MKILAHRGLWQNIAEQNSLAAIRNAFSAGFGVETDVRDFAGKLVISHNPPLGNEPLFNDMLDLAHGYKSPLAINIKADGLADVVHSACDSYAIFSWFVFDMSVPDTVMQMQANNPFFTRLSDIEKVPVLLDNATGIWLDAFNSLWYKPATIASLLEQTTICVVSEELHGRPYKEQWVMLQAFAGSDQFYLCTDKPEEAKKYFKAE